MTPSEIATVIRAERDTYAMPDEPDFFPNGAAFEALESLAHAFARHQFSAPRFIAEEDHERARKREFVERCGFDFKEER